jgi:hypothetical protein
VTTKRSPIGLTWAYDEVTVTYHPPAAHRTDSSDNGYAYNAQGKRSGWARKRTHKKVNLESQTSRQAPVQAPVPVNDDALPASTSQFDSFAVGVGFGTVALVAAPIVGPVAVAAAGIGVVAGAVKSMWDTGNNLQALESHNQRRIVESDNSVRRHEVDAVGHTERYKIDARAQLLRERGFTNGGKRTELSKANSRRSRESKKRDLWNGT